MKEFRFSWYVLIDEKVGVEGRSLVRGEKIEDEIIRMKEKLSREYFVRPSSVYITESSEMN
ncbi:hypothetical protein [Gottfriedia luciferensis]|uniref:hypothetical protein n=1 Tax=Gottfriedia luciferensis TaxID=178774 RepID=UPI000B42D717|nr:hypothetical protein [Gottfriedia luciferensis]